MSLRWTDIPATARRAAVRAGLPRPHGYVGGLERRTRPQRRTVASVIAGVKARGDRAG